MDDRRTACVFAASAETVPDRYRTLAADLGRGLAEAGVRIVYGGGRAGLMGEVAVAALAAGGTVTGIIPGSLNSRERAFDDVSELLVTETLLERKRLMIERADGFAILPGGIGTLDEVTEVLTTRHLGLHHHPVVLVDPDGFWDPFRELLGHFVDTGVMPASSLDVLHTAVDVPEAVAALTR